MKWRRSKPAPSVAPPTAAEVVDAVGADYEAVFGRLDSEPPIGRLPRGEGLQAELVARAARLAEIRAWRE